MIEKKEGGEGGDDKNRSIYSLHFTRTENAFFLVILRKMKQR